MHVQLFVICQLWSLMSPQSLFVSCILSWPLYHDLYSIVGKCIVRRYHASFLPAILAVVCWLLFISHTVMSLSGWCTGAVCTSRKYGGCKVHPWACVDNEEIMEWSWSTKLLFKIKRVSAKWFCCIVCKQLLFEMWGPWKYPYHHNFQGLWKSCLLGLACKSQRFERNLLTLIKKNSRFVEWGV